MTPFEAEEPALQSDAGLEVALQRIRVAWRDVHRELGATRRDLLQAREDLAAQRILLAGFAHELNNPLGTILINAQLLSSDTTDADAVCSIDTITEATRRCKALVETFLEYARGGTVEGAAEPLDLSEAARRACLFSAADLKQSHVTLIVEADDPVPVIGRPGELQQIVLNLLRNAQTVLVASASPAPVVCVKTHREGDYGVLAVQDNGPGIGTEMLPRLFEPFATTRPGGKGTGLGLYLSREMLKKQGGDIALQTDPGGGCVFTIRLPLESR